MVASWPITADGCTIVAGSRCGAAETARSSTAAARRVVADGDDEVVGADLRRAHDEIVVASEDGHAGDVVAARSERSSTPTAVWMPRATMASMHLPTLVGPADHDDARAHDGLPRNGSIVA